MTHYKTCHGISLLAHFYLLKSGYLDFVLQCCSARNVVLWLPSIPKAIPVNKEKEIENVVY